MHSIIAFGSDPENTLRADIYFAVFELNTSGSAFDRSDVIGWMKSVLDIRVSPEELATVLSTLKLADQIPNKKTGKIKDEKKKGSKK